MKKRILSVVLMGVVALIHASDEQVNGQQLSLASKALATNSISPGTKKQDHSPVTPVRVVSSPNGVPRLGRLGLFTRMGYGMRRAAQKVFPGELARVLGKPRTWRLYGEGAIPEGQRPVAGFRPQREVFKQQLVAETNARRKKARLAVKESHPDKQRIDAAGLSSGERSEIRKRIHQRSIKANNDLRRANKVRSAAESLDTQDLSFFDDEGFHRAYQHFGDSYGFMREFSDPATYNAGNDTYNESEGMILLRTALRKPYIDSDSGEETGELYVPEPVFKEADGTLHALGLQKHKFILEMDMPIEEVYMQVHNSSLSLEQKQKVYRYLGKQYGQAIRSSQRMPYKAAAWGGGLFAVGVFARYAWRLRKLTSLRKKVFAAVEKQHKEHGMNGLEQVVMSALEKHAAKEKGKKGLAQLFVNMIALFYNHPFAQKKKLTEVFGFNSIGLFALPKGLRVSFSKAWKELMNFWTKDTWVTKGYRGIKKGFGKLKGFFSRKKVSNNNGARA